MKKTDLLKELRDLPDEELALRGRQAVEERMKLRFRKASGQLEQGHRVREVRRTLARIETVRGERKRVSKE